MRRQRNISQMEEQDKTLEKKLYKMEASNVDAEFKPEIIRILKILGDE